MVEEINVTATVKKLENPTGLLTYLAGRFTYFSEAEWQRLITAGKVTRNGAILQTEDQVHNGDVLVSTLPAPPADIPPYTVIFEDDWLLVINKPAGLRVHGTGRFTRANLIYHVRQNLCGQASLINRLDADTSGVILLAKDSQTLRHCQRQFAARNVGKKYVAYVHGMTPLAGSISLSLREVKAGDLRRRYMRPAANGQRARTDYRHAGSPAKGISRLEVWPLTGRTHQIRAHLATISHPIVGDWQYGPGHDRERYSLKRHLLHCEQTMITHPVQHTPLLFTAPLPADFALIR